MHLLLLCNIWLDNVKKLPQYILWYTVWNSLKSLNTSHFVEWHMPLCGFMWLAIHPIWEETVEVHLNGDNYIQNFQLGRYIVGYTFWNHVSFTSPLARLPKTKFPNVYPKTCKYGDSVFGTVAAGGAQTEYPPKMGLEYFRLINNCHKLVITADKMQLWGPKWPILFEILISKLEFKKMKNSKKCYFLVVR